MNTVEINKKENVDYPRSRRDYDAKFHISKLPKGVEVGFKTGPFQEIQWGTLDNDWLVLD